MTSPENVKVVLLGELGVGKTCIISQLKQGDFNPDTVTSLNALFISKTLEFNDLNKVIKYDIWDTAGQERFRALAKIFYKDAKVICLCYDITSKKSFQELKDFWYEQQVKLNVDGEPIFAVVANKNDLYQNQQVKDEEGKEFARAINGIFQSTSAKSYQDILNLFNNIGHKLCDPNFDTNIIEDKEKEAYEKKKKEDEEKKYQMQVPGRGLKLEANKAKPQKKKGGFC